MSRAILLSLTLVFAACTTDQAWQPTGADTPSNSGDDGRYVEDPADQPGDDVVARTSSVDTLTGSFGDIVGFSDDLHEVEASIGPGHSTVTMHVLGEYGWAMLKLNIYGELGRFPLRAGETVYLSGFGIENGEEPDGPVADGSVQGCSGPDYWDWTEDTWTEDVSIGLSRDPDTGGLIVAVDAEFASGDHMTGTALVW